MENLWQRVKNHRLARISLAYLMIGWIILQIAEVMTQALRMPDWALSTIAYILIIGFPIVLLGAWALGSSNKKKGEETSRFMSGRNFDYFLLAGFALVIVFMMLPDRDPKVVNTASVEPINVSQAVEPVEEERASLTTTASVQKLPDSNTLAVLPFQDMSEAGDQDHFSDGLTDEIIYTLSDVPELRVVGRNSSFSFKGKNEDIKDIGKALNVSMILEGSVRKQGDQIRVTAQLIETRDGFHLWSETYDRTLEEVFSVQEEIATDIAQRLEISVDRLISPFGDRPDVHPEAYEVHLLGEHALKKIGKENAQKAIKFFEEAIEMDASFAKARSSLARAYILSTMDGSDFKKKIRRAELNALRAISLDHSLAEAYGILGWIEAQRRNYLQMDFYFNKALALRPNDVRVLDWYAYGKLTVGKLDEAIELYQKIVEIEPLIPQNYFFLATAQLMNNQLNEAEQNALKAVELGFPPANMPLADISGMRGQGEEAIKKARLPTQMLMKGMPSEKVNTILQGVYLRGNYRNPAIALVKEELEKGERFRQLLLPNFLILLGEPSLALETFKQKKYAFDLPFYVALWGPYGKDARRDESFKQFAIDIGFVEYWQQTGWPAQCQPVSNSMSEGLPDFQCE